MKIKIYLVLFILMFSLDILAQLKIDISNVKDEWILGEPIKIRIYLKNESNDILKTYGPLIRFTSSSYKMHISPMEGVQKMMIIEKFSEKSINYIWEYKPFWEYRTETGLFDYIINKPGLYNLKVIYDARAEASAYLNKGVYLGPSESNEIQLKVKDPQGIDKEAYEYFKTYPLANPKELLEKYPASIYAGWILTNYLPTLSLSINPELLLSEALDIKPNRCLQHCPCNLEINNEGKKVIAYSDEIAMRYANVASKFLEAHPDFYVAGPIYARLGTALVILNRWQQAKESYEKALKASWGNTTEIEERKAQIKKMIDLLKEKGYVK